MIHKFSFLPNLFPLFIYLPNSVFPFVCPQGGQSQTEWAAEIGPKILSYYEDYFNTSFPLPKQDMIAIPDFSAGAMENWGLITYREVGPAYSGLDYSWL